MYKPKPGRCKCLGFCGKMWDSPDVRRIRLCPRCAKKQGKDVAPRVRGIKVYNDGQQVSLPD